MRLSFLATAMTIALVATAPAHAGAGVSPFLAIVSPDALSEDVQDAYSFDGVEAVFVMSEADAESVSWDGYAWGPDDEPLVGLVSGELASDELLAITDSGLVTTRMLAVVDDALVDELVGDALTGPCRSEPDMRGVVQGDLISSDIRLLLPGLSSREPAVAVAEYQLDTSAITDLTARTTGRTAVSIINPDSMLTGGWCGAAPTPYP